MPAWLKAKPDLLETFVIPKRAAKHHNLRRREENSFKSRSHLAGDLFRITTIREKAIPGIACRAVLPLNFIAFNHFESCLRCLLLPNFRHLNHLNQNSKLLPPESPGTSNRMLCEFTI